MKKEPKLKIEKKPISPRLKKRKETEERHKKMCCRVFTCKIDESKLSTRQKYELDTLFVESKWHYNYMINWLSLDGNKISKFDTSVSTITHKDKNMNDVPVTLKHFTNAMRESSKEQLIANMKTIKTNKERGHQTHGGRIGFKKVSNSIGLKQYRNDNSNTGTYWIIKDDKTNKYTNKVHIQKIHGSLKVKGLEEFINLQGLEIANGRLIRRPDGYYIQFTTFTPKVEDVNEKKDIIGIDFGCETSFSLSNGLKFNVIVQESELLKRLQTKLNRRQKKGSKNYNKTRKRINVLYQKISNIKDDIANQFVSFLLHNYKIIVIQDEQIHKWQKNKHGKKVQHSILGRVKKLLKRSNQCYVLSKWYPTSKLCTNCGQKHNELKISNRVFVCDCGVNEDRDIHAAKNMVYFYYKDNNISVPTEHRDFKPVEIITSKCISNLLRNYSSYMSVKQEATCL